MPTKEIASLISAPHIYIDHNKPVPTSKKLCRNSGTPWRYRFFSCNGALGLKGNKQSGLFLGISMTRRCQHQVIQKGKNFWIRLAYEFPDELHMAGSHLAYAKRVEEHESITSISLNFCCGHFAKICKVVFRFWWSNCFIWIQVQLVSNGFQYMRSPAFVYWKGGQIKILRGWNLVKGGNKVYWSRKPAFYKGLDFFGFEFYCEVHEGVSKDSTKGF